MENKPFTIWIEGNIGVGKSKFLKYFNQFADVDIVPEPIEKWQNLNGANLLNLMYNYGEKWNFPFQSYATLLMLQNHLKRSDKKIKIMERSILSARYCFNILSLQTGKFTQPEYDILEKWFQYIDETHNIQTDLIIYLRSNPEHVFERIKQRGRIEEKNIPFDYIRRIHDLHEDWLMAKGYVSTPPVLVLDGSASVKEIQREYEKSIFSIPQIFQRLGKKSKID